MHSMVCQVQSLWLCMTNRCQPEHIMRNLYGSLMMPLSISAVPEPECRRHTLTVGSAALKAGAATLTTVSAADLTYGAAVSAARFTTGDAMSYACTQGRAVTFGGTDANLRPSHSDATRHVPGVRHDAEQEPGREIAIMTTRRAARAVRGQTVPQGAACLLGVAGALAGNVEPLLRGTARRLRVTQRSRLMRPLLPAAVLLPASTL